MKYRILGKTNLKVSVIGLGTWQYGGEWGKEFSQDEVTAIIRTAHDTGINLIDTAECYGDHISERFIGQAIKGLNLRDQFLIATKFGHKFNAPFDRSEPRSGPDIQKQLDDSLAALQTDYIDLYQYHSMPDKDYESADIRGVLEKAKQAGKIRHIGNSIASANTGTAQIEKSSAYHVESIQLVYNRLSRLPEDHAFPVCERLHLGVLARVPLASGFLSGKYKPGDKFPANDVRHRWQSKDADAKLIEAEKVQKTEVPIGVPMAQWALAWCLKSPAVQCVIPGCKSPMQVHMNALAAHLDIVDPKHPWAVK
ncbi:MAG: aldo/keto reductase [Phycisphaerales bacterium]|nr:aldo/keto reductase [Phycisphaerales bacterium]